MPRPGRFRRRKTSDFWSYVNKDGPVVRPELGPCWVWTGGLVKRGGYGKYRHGERIMRAHIYSYEAERGPVPEGMVLMHRCDNPPCVRPEHLQPGTPAENTADMMSKGRHGSKRSKPDLETPHLEVGTDERHPDDDQE